MPYAEGRTYYDADSHLMELGDWLVQYADPDVRDRIRPLHLGGAGELADEAVRDAEARRGDPRRRARARGQRDGPEGLERARRVRPGRAQPRPRSPRLRVATRVQHVRGHAVRVRRPRAPVRRHSRAQPRDGRLLPCRSAAWSRSGSSPLHDPELARRRRPTKRSRWDAARSWCRRYRRRRSRRRTRTTGRCGRCSRSTGVPFMLHIGGGGRPLRRAFHENGKPPVTDFLGGGENIRSKDYMALHHPPEIFLACMVLDGIFEQFPGLRGGCIEQGALWVVDLAAAPRHRAVDVPEDRARVAAAAQGERVPPPAGEVHAVPDRAGRLADRTGRPGAVLLLVRLSASRRRPRSARPVRGEPRRASTSRRKDRFYTDELRGDDGTGPRGTRLLTNGSTQ